MTWLKTLAGSLAVYVLAAACSGGNHAGHVTESDAGTVAAGGAADGVSAGGALGTAGSAETAGGGGRLAGLSGSGPGLVDAGLDAIADAAGDVLDPVPDAAAAGASGDAGGPGVGGSAGTGTGGEPGTGGAQIVRVCDCPEPPEPPDPYVPPEPEVVTVPCDVRVNYPGSTSAFGYFAEAAFPNRSASELSAVRAVLNYNSGIPSGNFALAGYSKQVTLPVVRDGRVATACGSGVSSEIVKADTVTFILPLS